MHATLRYYAGSDLASRLTDRREEITTLIREVPGVRAYYLIQAGSDSVSVTISDDAAGGERSSQVAAGWIRENLPDAGASAPNISSGEVIVSL